MKSSAISLLRTEMEKDAFFEKLIRSPANKIIKKITGSQRLKNRLEGATSGLSTIGLAGTVGLGGVAYGGMTLPPSISA